MALALSSYPSRVSHLGVVLFLAAAAAATVAVAVCGSEGKKGYVPRRTARGGKTKVASEKAAGQEEVHP